MCYSMRINRGQDNFLYINLRIIALSETTPPRQILGSHRYYNKNKRPPLLDPPGQ